ncbi:MAG: YbaB/EbfC family nucleoid-associated protein [Chloroflexi bacterium]|nr:YbaB/EbfC family nucleoid-associated protein [Chloroflexota bacterium]HLG51342.1 YbaB/EbfC family nucleoid-associated protein [Chloroflexota bacterium]
MRPNLNMMKQMQQKLAKIQEELGNETVEASAGGGAVTVVMTGHQKVVSVRIAPEAVDPSDLSMLEDLIVAAVNEAVEKSHELVTKRMGAITGGLKIPGLM